MKVAVPIARVALIVACALFAPSCGAQTSPMSKFEFDPGNLNHDDKALMQRIERYYSAEASRNWTEAYSLRTTDFRRLVPIETYAKQMAVSANGWTLVSIKALHLDKQGTHAIVRMRFVEKYDQTVAIKQFDKSSRSGGESVMDGEGIWENDGTSWFCSDAVTRNHLPLNSQMTY